MINKIPYSTNFLNNINYATKMRSEAIKSGIISPDWEWLLTSLIYDTEQLNILEKSLNIIENVMNDILLSESHQLDELMCNLNIPNWMGQYIFLDNQGAAVPLRWDIIFTKSGWKIIEINTGFCLGGLNAFSINDFRDHFYSLSDSTLNVPALDNSLHFIDNAISSFVKEEVFIPIIETKEGYDNYGFYLQSFTNEMNKQQGRVYIPGTIDDFCFERQSVFFKGQPVNYFIPMFNLYELSEEDSVNASFLHAIKNKKLTSLLGFRELIFSNKAFFTYIIRYIKEKFPNYLTKDILSLFPFTEVLTNHNITSFYHGDFILKPSEGYGGSGIVCSWDCNHREWIEALNKSLLDDNLWIIQERIIGEVSYMQSIDSNEVYKEGFSSVVHGFISLNGKIIGNLTRAAINIEKPGVINAHQGAAFGISSINLHNFFKD